jgi:hypothetical protein
LQEIVYQSLKKEKLSQIYNLCSTKPIKIKSLINLLYEKSGKEINYSIQKSKSPSFIVSEKRIRKNGYKLYSTKKSIIEFVKNN